MLLLFGGVGVVVYCCNYFNELAEGMYIFCLAILPEHIQQGSTDNLPCDYTGCVTP
jgi:hypothetical protein